MTVTKYPQSCLLIKFEDTSIVIDPGEFFTAEYSREELGPVGAVFYTHIHSDHLDEGLAEEFIEQGIPIYGNESVKEALQEGVNVVNDGDILTIGGIEITAHELDHCLMADGSEGPPNTGYIIDDTLFHPGDGIWTEGVDVDDLALPVAGPDISPKDGFAFAKAVGANRILPIHNDFFHENVEALKAMNKTYNFGYEFIDLKNGQSFEL